MRAKALNILWFWQYIHFFQTLCTHHNAVIDRDYGIVKQFIQAFKCPYAYLDFLHSGEGQRDVNFVSCPHKPTYVSRPLNNRVRAAVSSPESAVHTRTVGGVENVYRQKLKYKKKGKVGSVGCFHIQLLSGFTGTHFVSFRCSDFLPQSKHMQVRWAGNSKLSPNVWINLCVCVIGHL